MTVQEELLDDRTVISCDARMVEGDARTLGHQLLQLGVGDAIHQPRCSLRRSATGKEGLRVGKSDSQVLGGVLGLAEDEGAASNQQAPVSSPCHAALYHVVGNRLCGSPNHLRLAVAVLGHDLDTQNVHQESP